LLHPKATVEHLGYFPGFLREDIDRPARDQLDMNYQHGGGWRPFSGFKLIDEEKLHIQYPGDPPYQPIAMTKLRDERIVMYHHAWVAIFQPDNSFEIARMD
jgi:hypothetical protein